MGIDLSGNYSFAFTPECRLDAANETDPACDTFMGTLDGTDGKVVLDVDASFVDSCTVNIFEVAFEAEMAFYLDDELTEEVNDESDPFVIGQDTIYGKVVVDIPSTSNVDLSFSKVEVEAVYVCTAEVGADLSVNASTGLGGCLSGNIDDDGPYKVFGSNAVGILQGNTTYSVAANEAAFSFLTFDTPRETIHVHVQLLVTMLTDSGVTRRMRMLLQSEAEGEGEGEGNAFKSYIGTASVQDVDTTNAPLETDGAAAFSVGFMPAMIAVIGWMMME